MWDASSANRLCAIRARTHVATTSTVVADASGDEKAGRTNAQGSCSSNIFV